ncbi:unnamed protein product, partial [Ectocarpus sp. 12 AP-2014]
TLRLLALEWSLLFPLPLIQDFPISALTGRAAFLHKPTNFGLPGLSNMREGNPKEEIYSQFFAHTRFLSVSRAAKCVFAGEGTVSCHIARAVTLACRQHGPRRDEHNAPITLEHFYHKFFMDASWVEKRLEERRSLALDMRKFCRLHRVPLRCFPCPDEPEFRDME